MNFYLSLCLTRGTFALQHFVCIKVVCPSTLGMIMQRRCWMTFPPSSVLNLILLLTKVEQVLHSAALFEQLQYVIPFEGLQ